jgi:N,N'-diacetyllegionaminate synthase
MPEPPLVIAEVAQAHDGSLGLAHAFIDAAADSGANAIKFQTHIAAEESTPAEPWRVRFSRQDESRYDYWQRMEFTEEQWMGLRQHADERGLAFMSSPFSEAAFELLTRVGVSAWKVASGEATNPQLLDRMAATGLPIHLSTGMSTIEEIDRAVARISETGSEVTVMQCTSRYPTPPDVLGLNMIPFFRERYAGKVGLSDHSGTIYAGLAAAALGIDALEVHLTLSRDMFGPDVTSSITPAELRTLVDGVAFIAAARSSPVNKDALAEDLRPMRDLFTKSVVAAQALPAGTVLGPAHVAVKKPGTGIPAERLDEVMGRTLRRDVGADDVLTEADLV